MRNGFLAALAVVVCAFGVQAQESSPPILPALTPVSPSELTPVGKDKSSPQILAPAERSADKCFDQPERSRLGFWFSTEYLLWRVRSGPINKIGRAHV